MCSISVARDACFSLDKKKFLSDIIEHEACRELNVGESKIVSFSRSSSPTLTPHKYVLEKVKPDEYKVKLNLHFREKKIFQDRPKKIGHKMQTRINKCLAVQNPKLLGPNGEKLTIELVPLAEKHLTKYEEIKSTIFVDDDETARADSHHYTKQIDCPVILHELFHLMGLVDEYKERLDTHLIEQDCRSLGPSDSIMTDGLIVDWEETKMVTCSCSPGQYCKVYSKEEINNMTACPEPYGTMNFMTYFKFTPNENGERVEGIRDILSGKFSVDKKTEAPEPNSFNLPPRRKDSRIPNSVLYPAHFRAVVYPGCKAKNEVYYGCARDSNYRPFKFVERCSKKPAVCNDPTQWLK